MVRRNSASSHNRCHYRNFCPIYNLCKYFSRTGDIHASAHKEQWFLCLSKHLDRALQLPDMNVCIRFITTNIYFLRIFITAQFSHHILRKVYQDRSRSSTSCNVEGFFNNSSKIFPVSYSYSIFCNASGNSYNINLLKCIISYEMSCHLPRKADKRYTVIIRSCKPCHKICCTRTAGHQADAYLPGRSCISIRFMYQGNLLPWKNNLCIILLIQFVTDINRTCTRISENSIYSFFLQCLY